MSDIERIGIYGGTFDPIHATHLAIAAAARKQARLNSVLFVISAAPPHKGNDVFARAEDRFAMVEAAIAGLPGLSASRIELDRAGPSYTVDTLDTLAKLHPKSALFLILGYDSLLDLPHWRDPQDILDRARLLVVPRPGIASPPPEILTGHYDVISFGESALSSTEVRRRIAAGEEVSSLLPAGAEEVIRQRGLYHAPRDTSPI